MTTLLYGVRTIPWIVVSAALVATVAPVVAEQSPVGSYKAEYRNVSRGKAALEAYFGKSILRINADGTFELCGARQEGFWRPHGNRLVLNYSGLFGTPYELPDEVLKKGWPQSNLEGHVLDRGTIDTLVLQSFGTVRGPITFRRLPHLSTVELVKLSENDDMDSPSMNDAYAQLTKDATRMPEMLKMVGDKAVPFRRRNWILILLEGSVTSKNREELLQKYRGLRTESLPARHKVILQRSTSRALINIANEEVAEEIINDAIAERRLRGNACEAAAIAGYQPAVPRLLEWLTDASYHTRSDAAVSLARLGSMESRAAVAKLQSDPEPIARIGAWTAELMLAADSLEKNRAAKELNDLFGKTDFGDRDIIAALGDSRLRSAVPTLIVQLEGSNEYNARQAAAALARLGFREAVPALIGVKQKFVDDGPKRIKTEADLERFERRIKLLVDAAPLRKAVAEALWIFDRKLAKN